MKQIYILTILTILGLNSLYSQNNNYLNFDGTDDYVSTTLPSVFTDIPNNDITIESWIFPDTIMFSRILFAQLNTNNFVSISLLNDGTITCYVSNVAAENTIATIGINQWTHITMTWNHTTQIIQIYINGVLATLKTGTSNISSTGSDSLMTIGARTNLAQFYNGGIDELRIWDTIRTQTEISSSMNTELTLPQTNLVNYYKFNEGIGGANNTGITLLNDEINANDATLYNFTLNGLSSNWLNNSAVSVNDLTHFNSVKLYPNPSKDFIQISGIDIQKNYKIYNVLGEELKNGVTSGKEKIGIHNLNNGTYFLKLENGKTLIFIKE